MKQIAGVVLSLQLVATVAWTATAPSDEASRLRNRGLAELENEVPAKAEETFKQLLPLAGADPLPHANLAIATLRQQRFDEAREWIEKALQKGSDDPRLLAIQAEIAHWSGDNETALALFRRAATAAPNDRELQYGLYRQATTMSGEAATEAAGAALDRLAKLRPENLVVLLEQGKAARAAGDRAGATAAYLRVRELMWQAPRGGDRLMEQIVDGLEAADLEAIRSPTMRLENVLKISSMYKEGLRELSSGIQGAPIFTFRNEPALSEWGRPVPVTFRALPLATEPLAGESLIAGDLSGDEQPDIAYISGGEAPRLHVLPGGNAEEAVTLPGAAHNRLLAADLDNDGRLDLLAYGEKGARVWAGDEQNVLREATAEFGLDAAAGTAAVAFDYDIEGDLDLFLGDDSLRLYRNTLEGALEEIGAKSLPSLALDRVNDARATDLDLDGDLDLLLASDTGLYWLDNLRQGRFADRSAGLQQPAGAQRVASADFDNDGWLDLVAVGDGIRFWRGRGGRFVPWEFGGLRTRGTFSALTVFDADNDGRLDLAVAGDAGVAVLLQREGGSNFALLPVAGMPAGVTALANGDFDQDGDLDLVAGGTAGVFLLQNEGGNANRHLTVRLRGLNKGNSKNNVFGLGSTVELKAGTAYQLREADTDAVHLGLGSVRQPDLMRVVWTNGVPQNRLDPTPNQRIVEEQQLKGSCPFLYAWEGNGYAFVTDLLWGAPAGLPIAEGVYLGADPTELVRVDRLAENNGRYELRITEELWEAAFFDYLRLWVVDHPDTVEVASSLRIQPGASVPERVLASHAVRPVAAAWDASGTEVTEKVLHRDEIYADGWERSPYQGVASDLWTFTLDLGTAPNRPVRLHLDGWIFPADASLNLALAQREGPQPVPPSLEVLTGDGWQVLMPSMGFPAGKTKTMIVDTPPLPPDASRLRIVSGQWLSWDRIAWSIDPADDEPVVLAKLAAETADLRKRGFSARVRQAPNAPHTFDYQQVTTESPWLPFPGRYTRYGDVRELLDTADDRSVILAPGDEIALSFDVADLPAPPAGWRRTLFLESHGWDKDADRNTGEGLQVGPLPFRAMSGYPYGPDERFPDTPLHRDYIENWLTREVTAEPAPGERWAVRRSVNP